MRIIRFLIFYVMVSVLGFMALIFLALNHYTIQIDLVDAQYPVSVAWVMVGSAVFGFAVALLLVLPGRLAVGLHARTLERTIRKLERSLAEREDMLEDQEEFLDEREELRARLVEQHELLLERHERMLARHQALVDDHSQVTVQRDEARAQLSALRIARPSAHTSGAATALRLLPQPQPTPIARHITPVPAARPAIPVPVASIAASAPQTETRVEQEPAPQPAQRAPTPGPWRLLTPEAATPALKTPEVEEVGEAEAAPPPTTVPVVSAAPASPAVATPAPVVAPVVEPVAPPVRETSVAPLRPRRNIAAQMRTGADHVRQEIGATLVRSRQGIGTAWSGVAARGSALRLWIAAQAAAQRARLGRLWRRMS